MRRVFQGVVSNSHGNMAVLTAFTMPLFIAGVAFALETASWYYDELKLQQAADKAAYTAGIEKRAGSNTATILKAATEIAQKNGFSPGSIVVNYPPKSGAYTGNKETIEVNLTQEVPRYFSSIFVTKPIIDNSHAVARMQNAGDACVLALSTSAPRGIDVSGSGQLNLKGCNVMSNSTAADSIYVGGSGYLSADCLISVGSIDIAKSNAAKTTCSSWITDSSPAGDIFSDLTDPDTASAPIRANSNGAVLQPGNYINGMTLKNTQTLSSGLYIVSGGSFQVNANAFITGVGVTIYFKAGVTININGNATLQLSAPTTGPYAGVLFFGDRTATGSVKINGTAQSLLTGALYFKGQDVDYLGNFSGLGGCTQVVANTIKWSGNSTIKQDCAAYGMRTIPATTVVQLVE